MQRTDELTVIAELAALPDDSSRAAYLNERPGLMQPKVVQEIAEAVRKHVRVDMQVGSSRVDLQACKLEYSIVSPK